MITQLKLTSHSSEASINFRTKFVANIGNVYAAIGSSDSLNKNLTSMLGNTANVRPYTTHITRAHTHITNARARVRMPRNCMFTHANTQRAHLSIYSNLFSGRHGWTEPDVRSTTTRRRRRGVCALLCVCSQRRRHREPPSITPLDAAKYLLDVR